MGRTRADVREFRTNTGLPLPESVAALFLPAFYCTPVTLIKLPITVLTSQQTNPLYTVPNAFPRGPSSVSSPKLFTPCSVYLGKLSSQAPLRVTSRVEVGPSK